MQAHKQSIQRVDAINQLEDVLFTSMESQSFGTYEPTGLQEDIIVAFGQGEYEIVLALHPNDVGKTTAGAQIAKNIIWPHDPKWFSWWPGYSFFRDKKFELRTFRITAQHTNLTEEGAIQTEIQRWWPQGRYEWQKGGQHYPSKCICDTGWSGDALSFNQSREEHESKKVSFLWSDEPPPADLLGAMTSRFSEGMLWLITATPVKCGAFLDIIKDMEDGGTKIKRLTGSAWQNSTNPEKGKPNHLRTKYGLRSDAEILSKIARCPRDERDARIYGKASTKAGKRYPDFNRDVHVRFFELGDPDVKKWNCYMSMDPHYKYYPFIQWWAVRPDNKKICFNEWPTYDFLGGFYDEIRDTLQCPWNVEDIANFIKLFDGSQYGINIIDRFMDPYYGYGSTNGAGNGTESLCSFYLKHGIIFTLPPRQQIDVQCEAINQLIKYDPQMPVCESNEPDIFWMPHCVNSIRMMERHFWDEDKEKESPKFKEGPDCTRIFLAGLGGNGYINHDKKETRIIESQGFIDSHIERLHSIALG